MRNNKNNISFSVRNITLNHKILTSFYRILTSHFTGKEKIITLRFKNITLCLSILIFSLLNIINTFTYAPNTSALNYQSSVNIGFTFNPTISVSISPNNLIIPNLTPGIAADSNTVTVNVTTNTAYGYNLTANVGNNTDNYDTTNLVHTTSSTSIPTTNATFASLAYGSRVVNKDSLSPNTWGYSYSDDSGATWRPYSGLPLYSDTNHSTNLISTYTAADSKSIEFKIAAKASETQPSGDYTNIINFYATSVPEPPLLYDVVESMSKGTLAENNVKLSDTITQANSGVYTYDPTVYGITSDASNDYDIYFYRGILDSNLDGTQNTYGSNGDGKNYPNYVKLGDTCWRIVRTTGSGGTKMIYNGLYSAGTNSNSCANLQDDAQVAAMQFNTTTNIGYKSIIAVGYTFNSNYKETTADTLSNLLFGTNDNYSGNSTDSTIKDYLENTWFTSAIVSYENKLEPSAGYCNDRSIYGSDGALLAENADISTPYTTETSGVVVYYFGANRRNMTPSQLPSLRCATYTSGNIVINRSTVDLYSVNGSIGNGQLSKPVALLTADEASFAGSGSNVANNGSGYHYNSYLRSGRDFWLFSPFGRNSGGGMRGVYLHSDGNFNNNNVYTRYGVRPVISLMHHIQVTSGSGTATNPWTIE